MVSSSCVFVPGWIDPSVHSQLQEEKIAAVQAKLEHAEQELAQFAKLPEMEEQLKQRMEALTQVRRPNQVRRGIHFHHIKISPLYDHHSSLSCYLYLSVLSYALFLSVSLYRSCLFIVRFSFAANRSRIQDLLSCLLCWKFHFLILIHLFCLFTRRIFLEQMFNKIFKLLWSIEIKSINVINKNLPRGATTPLDRIVNM